MFSFVADALTIVLTVLFPIFASYKALQSNDPAQLVPWLAYFLVISLVSTAESVLTTFLPLLSWLPFYAWLRLGLHLFLLLPGQTQGAGYVYATHVRPFLEDHERQIETFISETHNNLQSAGLEYVKQLVDYIKTQLLGQAQARARSEEKERQRDIRPSTPEYASYAQSLLARFTSPQASQSTPAAHAGAGGRDSDSGNAGGAAISQIDVYSLLSSALSGLGAAKAEQSRTIVPDTIEREEDRMSYIAATGDRLRALLRLVEQEEDVMSASGTTLRDTSRATGSRTASMASGLDVPGRMSARMRKSGSETDFEAISTEDLGASAMSDEASGVTSPPSTGGWWSWGARKAAAKDLDTKGHSSAVDRDLQY